MNNPLCPVTGEPAVRLVQWVKAGFLVSLWRTTFKVDVRPSFGANARFGLWESPTGLYFFDPLIEGDHEFYTRFYDRLLKISCWNEDHTRQEFQLAARHIARG